LWRRRGQHADARGGGGSGGTINEDPDSRWADSGGAWLDVCCSKNNSKRPTTAAARVEGDILSMIVAWLRSRPRPEPSA